MTTSRLVHGDVVDTPLSLCRFGFARRDITPPVGIYHRMWGAALHDRSEGVHRPLISTALVFGHPNDQNNRQVIVTLDHCLLLHPEMEQLTQRICSSVGIDAKQLLVTFSHTHAAGLMDPSRSDMPGGELIAPYLKEVAASTVDAIREAIKSTHPVTITYLSGRCGLAADRDFWDARNKSFVCGFNPARQADDTLLVARVTDERDQLVATIVNYACHPTTLAWDNRLISPDYPGAMREVVEEQTGAPCAFLLGACGDLGPKEGYVGDTEVADRNGRMLGLSVLATLVAAPPPRTHYVYGGSVASGANIGTWDHQGLDESTLASKRDWRVRRWTMDMPYRDGLPSIDATSRTLRNLVDREKVSRATGDEAGAREARALAERSRRLLARLAVLPSGDSYPYPIILFRLGDAIWLLVEGEPYNSLQLELRRRFPHTPIIVTVLAGGWRPSYLPTKDTYDKGIYQESIAVFAAGCLERLIDEVVEQIERLLQRGVHRR